MTTEQVMRGFMIKMDRLWKLYDQAIDKLPRGDALAYKRYAENLDKFFVCYWQAFSDSVNITRSEDLVRTSDAQYEESLRILEATWHNTNDALMRRATDLQEISRARSLPQHLPIFQKAERKLRELRKREAVMARITSQTEAADLLEQFIDKLESAK